MFDLPGPIARFVRAFILNVTILLQQLIKRGLVGLRLVFWLFVVQTETLFVER
jgi:hypothetical protein